MAPITSPSWGSRLQRQSQCPTGGCNASPLRAQLWSGRARPPRASRCTLPCTAIARASARSCRSRTTVSSRTSCSSRSASRPGTGSSPGTRARPSSTNPWAAASVSRRSPRAPWLWSTCSCRTRLRSPRPPTWSRSRVRGTAAARLLRGRRAPGTASRTMPSASLSRVSSRSFSPSGRQLITNPSSSCSGKVPPQPLDPAAGAPRRSACIRATPRLVPSRTAPASTSSRA